MPDRFDIEVEPEVRSWLDGLPLEQYAKAEAAADLLAERAETLGEPYSRHLGGKTRQRERAEVERAVAAQRACERGHAAGHPDHGLARDVYERKWD